MVSASERRRLEEQLAGRRVLITGAARGIGASLARRLHGRGARVALLGLEPELLEQVATVCGGAPWRVCDVRDRAQTAASVAALVDELGGLDVVVVNAGVAAQLPLLGGDPAVMDRTVEVNLLGTYATVRAAGPYVAHPGGYALLVASAAAGVQLPMLGAYSASKAAVEALGNTLRIETRHLGMRVGVAYLAEIDTDMTAIGFGTAAARSVRKLGPFTRVAPLSVAVDAFERGIARRRRRVYAPRWVATTMRLRMLVQRLIELRPQPRLAQALDVARTEHARLTTELPDRAGEAE
ncbi:SDR family NAD(P)-dependent oxidoreductase [Prescottella defluvii]|uniref:SDR family NAD(P)-dependent oxidoreductase n=1 Tax=Prescottella defluvii TaxID=1323361 RepID=UPI0004F397D6|nr:SDR family NAD(P)-dependent oxidoreductase [Prescottella defluvii]